MTTSLKYFVVLLGTGEDWFGYYMAIKLGDAPTLNKKNFKILLNRENIRFTLARLRVLKINNIKNLCLFSWF